MKSITQLEHANRYLALDYEYERSISKVAAAKAKHLAIRARIEAGSAVPEFDAYGHENLLYLSPIRIVSPIVYRGTSAPLGPDGQVVDTPEVAVARAAHLKAHARAVALTTGYDIYC